MMNILFEDNHIIAINKNNSDLVQGDKTGDTPLSDKVKAYIKAKYDKPGDVYLGVPHRLDRPVSGVVLFARTSKALVRLNQMFKDGEIKKTYWAITKDMPPETEGRLEHYVFRNTKQNKSYANDRDVENSKKALLFYKCISRSDKYNLLEIDLKTGRHHQIRCQLAKINCAIKGDLKYGAPRSNKDGGISLHARSISFMHPVKKEEVSILAPPPKDNLWEAFLSQLK